MNKRIFKIIFFNLISLLFFGSTFLVQIPAGVLAANPVPNCQISGPESGTVGATLTFNTLYRTRPAGSVWGDTAVRHNDDFPLLQSTSWAQTDSSTLTWTPSAAGTYQVFCRASNGIDFECVGNGSSDPREDLYYANDNQSYYGDPPSAGRHNCTSPLAHLVVNVSAPAARDTTPPVTTPSNSSTTRRTGDVVSVNLSATDSGGSGVKQINWGLFPGATDCSSAQIDPIYTSGRSTSGVISGGSGSVPNITVPSCLQYWAEDNAANKENNGNGLNFPVNSNSSRTSTLSSIDPATGYRYGQSVTVNFSSTGTGTIHTTVWPGISTCNETDKSSVTFQYQGLTGPSANRSGVVVPSCIEYKTDDETTAHQHILGPADATRPVTTFTLVSHGGDRSQVISNEMQQVRFDTTYDRVINYVSVTAVKVPGATDLASARSQAVADSGWAGANRHYDSGRVVDIRAPFYVQFQAVASDGNIESVREDFVPGIPETTASVWIAESQANLDACATDASKCTKIAYTAGMTTATYRFSSIGSRRLFVRYVSNANSPRDDDINAAGGLAISYVANPDCYIASGPDTVYTGQTAVYTGQYSLTPGTAGDHLDGDIVVKQGGSIVACEAASDTDSSCNGKEISGFGGSHNFSWRPTAVGSYEIFCRAFNRGKLECDGNLSAASGAVRACPNNATGHKTVNVVRDDTPPTTTVTQSRTTGLSKGDLVDVTFAASDPESGISQTTVAIWPNKKNRPAGVAETYYCPSADATKCPAEWHWGVSGGTIPNLPVPSYIEYNAVNGSGKEEKDAHPEGFIAHRILSDDSEKPTSTVSGPPGRTGYRRGEPVTVHITGHDNKGLSAIYVSVWPGTAKSGAAAQTITVLGRNQIDVAEDVTPTTTAPYYMEVRAVDVNDNVEDATGAFDAVDGGDTDNPGQVHKLLAPLDAARPNPTVVTPDKTTDINNGNTVNLSINGSDDAGGSGLGSIFVTVYPGAKDLTKKNSRGEVVTGIDRSIDVAGGRSLPVSIPVTVPSYIEYNAADRNNNTETGSDIGRSLSVLSDDSEKPTSTVSGPAGRTGYFRDEVVPITVDATDNRGLGTIFVAYWSGNSKSGAAGDVIQLNGNNERTVHLVATSTIVKAPFYAEIRATDINGNLEDATGADAVDGGDTDNPGHVHKFTTPLDTNKPTTTVSPGATADKFPTPRDKGQNLEFTFRGDDETGGSGVSDVKVVIWEGATTTNGKFNDNDSGKGVKTPTSICTVISQEARNCPLKPSTTWAATGGTINIKVSSYVEYYTKDRAGNYEDTDGAGTSKGFVITSDDSEKPTSTVSGPAGRTGYGRNEAVPVHITAHDNRGIGAVFVAVWSGNDKSGTLAPIITINGNNQTDIAQDVIPATKAPYYMEVRAIDRNGNVEDASGTDAVDGQDSDNPGHVHAFKTLLDTTVPNATTVTPDKTTDINNNDSVTLHFAGSDNTGGSGVAVIYVTVWPGAKSATDRDAKAAAGHPITSQNKTIAAAAAGDATVTVPSYIEYNAQDKAGNTETGSDTGRPLSVLSDDSEKPTSTVSGPSGRSGFYPGEAVALSVEARDNRRVRGVEMSVWQGVSNASEKWDPDTTAPTGKSFKSGTGLSHHIGTGDGKTAAWSDEVTGLTAPFYMEYQAVDINGNIEGDGSSPHTFTVPMDTTVPSVTVSALPSPRDNDSTIELTVSGADESGGSGLAATWVTIWEGAKDANGKFNDGKTSDSGLKQPTYACPSGRHETTGGITISAPCPFSGWGSGGGTARVKVPSLVEYNVVDRAGNWNKLVASGEGVQLMVLNDDNGSDKRPTSAMTASPASGFRKDQDVTMTFEARDNRDTSSKAGTRLIYVTVWEGVAGREQLLAKYNNDGNAINAAAVHKDITGPRGTVTAKVPFYVQWQALDINDNIEDDTGSDKVDNGSGFGAHSFGADFPEEAATVRIAESEAALADSGTHSDFPFNPTAPIITYNFSGGLSPGSTKTLFAKFISNKNHSSAVLSIGSVHRLASGEGTAFSFSPASGSFMVGGSALDVAVQLNTNVPTIRNYNISAVDVLIKVSDSRFFSSFDPSSSSGLITLANTNNVTAGQTTIHYIGYRTSSTDVKGTVSLGTIHLLAPAGISGTSLSVSTSIDGTPKLTSTDVSGPVPVGSSGSGTYSVIQPTNTPTLTPTLTPTATSVPTATSTPVATASPTGRVSAPPVTTITSTLSPALSPTGRITSPPGRLACDFNKNGAYDDGDLDVWTREALGISGGLDADCAGDGIDSADGRVDILDLNRWRRLKYGL